MKPGDLVVFKKEFDCDLYSDAFLKNINAKNRYTGKTITLGATCIVLDIKKLYSNITGDKLVKVLTKEGVGWLYQDWVIKEK